MLPKLSRDHKPGSATESVLVAAWPHPEKSLKFVTVAPLECDALVVPLTFLVIPVKSFPETPV